MTPKQRDLCLNLLSLFQLEGKKVSEIVTEGEIEIFSSLIFRNSNRLQIICATQYGKSFMVALACLVISCIQKELIAVVAPKSDKAKIIMRYYIEHLGDNPIFWMQLEKDTKLERLRMEENKERIILKNSGGIFVISAQAGNAMKGFESAMGEGARIVIQDESCLIPDSIEATIFRMIAGHKEGFYCKIGNPFYRNHFLKSWNDSKYQKIFINYVQGLREGRYTEQFIEEARKKPHFEVLFNCQFPKADMIDQRGFSVLLTEDDLNLGLVEPFGEERLGVDVAESGGNFNVIAVRYANIAKVLLKYQTSNTMDFAGRIIQLAKEFKVIDRNIFVDGIGIGKGLVDRLHEQKWLVHEVKSSNKAEDEEQFSNVRAENYWRVRRWIKEGGILDDNPDWMQLLDIKYKVQDSSGKLVIMSKEDMLKEGIESPDVADALALTFSRKSIIKGLSKRQEEREILKDFDAIKQRQGYKTGSPYLNKW